jgi:uncharacterized protein
MSDIEPFLIRITDALERLAPALKVMPEPEYASVWEWDGASGTLAPIQRPRQLPLDLILGCNVQKERLIGNTQQFARGHGANHAMLWGARGTGKSALVKAIHGEVAKQYPQVKLIEVSRNDIATVPLLAEKLNRAGWRAILFIDDLSFERGDESYKALKSVLDGGVSGHFASLLVYVTSNRRHLVNRPDGNQADFRPDETIEEQVALSERFGMWLGFHAMDQATWLEIVRNYARVLSLKPNDRGLERAALQWAAERGSRTGRSAWQFIIARAGEMGKSVTL